MSRCRLCKQELMTYTCPDCTRRWLVALAEHDYPEPFIEAGIEPTQFEWEDCKLAGERAMNQPGATPEDFKKESDRVAVVCIKARERKAREAAKTPAQRRAEKEEDFKKRFPY